MSEIKRKRPSSGGKQRSNSTNNHDHRDYATGNKLNANTGRSSKMAQGSPGYKPRTNSFDRVRKLVEEEGRTARNLVTWSVPFDDSDESDEQVVKARRKKGKEAGAKSKKRGQQAGIRTDSPDLASSAAGAAASKAMSKPAKRVAAVDLQARYWAFLFDNLKRAVDEIYQTCEQDESIVECKEVLMILSNCTRDFQSLIQRIQLQKDFESTAKENRPTSLSWEVRKSSPGKTRPPPNWPTGTGAGRKLKRPTSLAWEVRKSSPGKGLGGGTTPTHTPPPGPPDHSTPSPPAADAHQQQQQQQQQHGSVATGPVEMVGGPPDAPVLSWADKVKGRRGTAAGPHPSAATVVAKPIPVSPRPAGKQPKATMGKDPPVEEAEEEGWLKVQRGGKHGKLSNGKNKSANQLPPVSKSVASSSQGGPASPRPSNREPASPANQPATRENRKNGVGKATEGAIADAAKPAETSVHPVNSAPEGLPHHRWSKVDSRGGDGRVSGSSDSDLSAAGDHAAYESLSSEDEPDNQSTDEELATELDHAMEAALKEEETLTTELEKCRDEALASAIETEEDLRKQIEEEENNEIVVETENEDDSELGATMSTTVSSLEMMDLSLSQSGGGGGSLSWGEVLAQYEAQRSARENTTWGEMVEVEERHPGHGVKMHEKLSSPSRKRTRAESARRLEEKQKRAQQKRKELQEDKALKLRQLHEKIMEVRNWKDELVNQKKKEIDERLQQAEEKREKHMQAVVRKAQEEEAKVNEIAFINSLEAQNKRHEIMSRHEVSEARLQEIVEERQRKQVEKAAKEEAAQERRRAMEEERVARLEALARNRRQQEEKMESLREERDQLREEASRQRTRVHQARISALNAAQVAKEEGIREKIQQKHDESSRRHTKHIEDIREKAVELSTLRHYSTTDMAPKQMPYQHTKLCNVCNVLISSEVYLMSHIKGRRHREALQEALHATQLTDEEIESYSLKHMTEAMAELTDAKELAQKDRHKALKKRARKIRLRMSTRGRDYENGLKEQPVDSEYKTKLQKVVKEVNKLLQGQGSGPWPANKVSALDRALGETARIMEKKVPAHQEAFCYSGGLTALARVLLLAGDTTATSTSTQLSVLPAKTLCSAANVFRLSCQDSAANSLHMLYSSKVGPMLDLLTHRLALLTTEQAAAAAAGDKSSSPRGGGGGPGWDPVASAIMRLVSTIFNSLPRNGQGSEGKAAGAPQHDVLSNWKADIVSYLVSSGVVDLLTSHFNSIHSPVTAFPDAAAFLQDSIHLLMAATKLVSPSSTRAGSIFEGDGGARREDPTQLTPTLEVTALGGIVSTLYGILLHSGMPSRTQAGGQAPPRLPPHTVGLVQASLSFLSSVAVFNLQLLQTVLGGEGISLEFRHIATHLIWYHTHYPDTTGPLLQEVLLVVGYFTVLNPDNQVIVQSGNTPTLLQQLCNLPFQYFSDPRLTDLLYPTLIACCYGNAANRHILQQEVSSSFLSTFIGDKQREVKQMKLRPSQAHTSRDKDPWHLDMRFPVGTWEEAKKFFQN